MHCLQPACVSACPVKAMTKDPVTGVVAFLTGVISVYSSTSGVVLPAFLPMVPGLAEQLGANQVLVGLSLFLTLFVMGPVKGTKQ